MRGGLGMPLVPGAFEPPRHAPSEGVANGVEGGDRKRSADVLQQSLHLLGFHRVDIGRLQGDGLVALDRRARPATPAPKVGLWSTISASPFAVRASSATFASSSRT